MINDAALGIIKRFEGWRPHVYRCPAGIPTIGWGSIWDIDGNRVTMDHPPIDELRGASLLTRELRHVEGAIAKLIKFSLVPNQLGALASFTFNLGSGRLQSSTLRAKLNRGDIQGAADEFPKWRRAGGKILNGLVRRRAEERALFLREEHEFDDAADDNPV